MIKHVCLFQQKIAAGGNPVFELENVGLKAAMDLLKSSSSDVTETVITDFISKFRHILHLNVLLRRFILVFRNDAC